MKKKPSYEDLKKIENSKSSLKEIFIKRFQTIDHYDYLL